jgi:hypothetical protein
VAPAAAELTPQQIAVVVNRSSRESARVGHYYAKQRGVPDTHVIPLELGAMREGSAVRNTSRRSYVACVRHSKTVVWQDRYAP